MYTCCWCCLAPAKVAEAEADDATAAAGSASARTGAMDAEHHNRLLLQLLILLLAWRLMLLQLSILHPMPPTVYSAQLIFSLISGSLQSL